MGDIRTSANASFRDYETDGVPASGAHEPVKTAIRTTFGVVEDTVEVLRQATLTQALGIRWSSQTIRVRATANVDIATALENGDTLDGVTLATGDHVLLPYQSTASQNGIYTVPASGAASRASFADSAAELERIGVRITAGTAGAGELWTLPLDADEITVGTTSLNFANLGAPFDLLALANTWAAANTFSLALTVQGLTIGKGKLTSVAQNTFVGEEAGASASLTGGSNSGFGFAAGLSITSGSGNSLFGNDAGRAITTGLDNVIVGDTAGVSLTTGSNNLLAGKNAGAALTDNTGCVLLGTEAGFRIASGGLNAIAIGNQAMRNNLIGTNCVVIGTGALFTSTSAINTFAIGTDTLYNLTTGTDDVMIGHQAGGAMTTGSRNVGLGNQSLVHTTTGDDNTFVGDKAGDANTTGSRNTGVGSGVGYTPQTGDDNTYLGARVARGVSTNCQISRNTGVGSESLRDPATGADDNTVVGFRAGYAITTGADNTLVGSTAGDSITTGSRNIAIGEGQDVDSATGNDQINVGGRYFHDRIRLLERSSDPAEPAEGEVVIWMGDGTGKGDDGDVMIASKAGGVTKWAVLFDHSAGQAW